MASNLNSLQAIVDEGNRLKAAKKAATRTLADLDGQIAQTKATLEDLEAQRVHTETAKTLAESQEQVIRPR